MYKIILWIGIFLGISNLSLALTHFTLDSEELISSVRQCQTDFSLKNIEHQVLAQLSTLSNLLNVNTLRKQLNPELGLSTGKLKLVHEAITAKVNEMKVIEYMVLDGLVMKDISAVELGVIDNLTKHLDATQPYYKDQYPIQSIVSGNRTYIERFCQTYLCRDGNEVRPFSLKSVNPSVVCSDALCAIKQIYGEDKGPLILFAYLKYELNLSPRTHFNADPNGFDLETLTAVLTAANLIPDHLRTRVLEGTHFYRFARGKTLKIYSEENQVIANATGAVFDAIDKYSFNEKVYIILHEMGHRASRLAGGRNIIESSSWKQVAQVGAPISQYSMINDSENFAESFVLYRLRPEKLIESSEPRFLFMKKEFLTELIIGKKYVNDTVPQSNSI